VALVSGVRALIAHPPASRPRRRRPRPGRTG
jgi:hypothetical protein